MKKLLIIDDDDILRNLLKRKFGKEYSISEAENGIEGLKQFKNSQPDLVITDIIMPEEEGFKTIMDIRKLDIETPIIAITGMPTIGSLDTLEIAKELGANLGYLKPLDLNDLSENIKSLLN